MSTKTDGKSSAETGASGPANVTGENNPAQTQDAAIGGGGMGTANPDEKKEDATERKEGDPVSVATGAVVEDTIDVLVPGVVPFQLRRRYSSARCADRTPFGRGGWTHDYHQWIEPEGDGWLLRNYNGVDLRFGPIVDGGAALHRGRRLLLRRHGSKFELLEIESREARAYETLGMGGPAWLQSVTDRYGNRLTFHYEGRSLAQVTDTAGRAISFRLDDKQRIAAIDVAVTPLDDARSAVKTYRLATYGYSPLGELEAIADALGQSVRYAYDGKHRVVEKRMRNGFTIRYEYEPIHGRAVRTWGDGGYHSVEFIYDFDKRTTTTHGSAEPRVYHWDAHGNVLREETFDGRYVVERVWDADHLLLSEKNAAGEEDLYEYDARGFLTAHTDAAGNISRFEYVDDLLRKVIRPNGAVRTYDYDGYGGLWGTTIETGARYSVDRDGKGRIAAVYCPDGLLLRYEHDAHHNVVKKQSALGGVTRYAYDDLGRPISRTDPLGLSTTLEYDAADRVIAVTHPDGVRVQCEYDGLGNLTRLQKPGGEVFMEHAATGAMTRLVVEDGGEWRITHDRNERPSRITNPKGEVYEIIYDRAGRVVEERTFDGRTLRYGHDLAGRVRRIDRPDGTYRELTYDPIGNVLTEESTHGSITYVRSQDGLLLEAVLEEGPVVSTVKFERDSIGRIVAESQDGQSIHYAYNAEGRVSERRLPSGEVTRYRYDLEGRLAAVDHGGHVVQITRDAKGQQRLRHILGSPSAIAATYDPMGRTLTQEAVPAAPESANVVAALIRRSWSYDSVGRPQRIEDARWGPTDYFYNKTHHLLRARRGQLDEVFDYDPAGTLVRAFSGLLEKGEWWSVKQGDVLARTETATYEYDKLSRRTAKTELENGKPTGRRTEYVWDCRDRLREVRLPDGAVVRLFYDAFGRRTRKIHFAAGLPDKSAPPRVVRFLWEGDVLAAELDADLGARVYVHEPGGCWPLLQAEQGEVLLYVLDQVGVPRELVDSKGRVAWAAAYKTWGTIDQVVRDSTAPRTRPIETPFRLLGHYADEETGLHITRFRYWDPEVGRFCSADPLGLQGGTNLFSLGGAPTWLSDPWGLADEAPQTTTIYRVEGPGNGRVVIGPGGNVTIPEVNRGPLYSGGPETERALWLNFGSEERAQDFLQKRQAQGHTDVIRAFEVPKDVADQILARQVAEREATERGNRLRPVTGDPKKAAGQLGLRAASDIDEIRKAAIAGSGRKIPKRGSG